MAAAEFQALGTVARVLTVDKCQLERACEAVHSELEAIDMTCSRFRDDSELSQVNQAGGSAVTVSPLFTEALKVALRASRLTNGILDPTVGEALVQLGYDRDFEDAGRQEGPFAPTVRPTPGWRLVHVDERAGTVTVPFGVRLDLGATAKALAADRAARSASRAARCGVLVSLGGDIALGGESPAGGWPVRVADDCRAELHARGQTVLIASGGLATSSTTVRRWSRGGATLHHIIDPSTGMPAHEHWRTVSVAAGSCVDANTASTAAIVLAAAATSWLTERSLPSRLVAVDGGVRTVAGWPAEDAEELPPAA